MTLVLQSRDGEFDSRMRRIVVPMGEIPCEFKSHPSPLYGSLVKWLRHKPFKLVVLGSIPAFQYTPLYKVNSIKLSYKVFTLYINYIIGLLTYKSIFA